MTRAFPAGAGEKMQYAVHEFNDNTIRFVLRYPGLLRPETLRQAAYEVVSRAEVLHASFVSGRMGAKWCVNDFTAEDCFRRIHAEDALCAALNCALEPICPSDTVQMRCTLVQDADESVLVLAVSHLCVDGSDGKYLLRKLVEAYELILRQGNCEGLTLKDGARDAGQVYAQLGKEERRRLLTDPRTGIKSVFPLPSDEPGEPVVLARRIGPDTMEAARLRAKAAGATVNDLLLTACYHAYAAAEGVDPHGPMSVSAMMDLRRHCEGGDSAGLSNLTGPLTTALPRGVHDTFPETLAEIAAQTRRCKDDPLAGLYGMPLLHGAARRLPMGVLLSAAGRLYGSLSVGLTNIGSFTGAELSLGGCAPAEGFFGGPIKRKPGVQISAASFGGACALCIWGYAAQADHAPLQRLLEDMTRHVQAFAAADS